MTAEQRAGAAPAGGGRDAPPDHASSRDGGELLALRRDIERMDRQILAAVAERMRLARRIGELKRERGRPTLDPEREAAVIRRATELGREAGLKAEDARELFWSIVGICRRAQLERDER